MMARMASVLGLLALCHCGHTTMLAQPLVGTPLLPQEAMAFRARMDQARVPLEQLALSAKTSRFGPEGRARVTLQLVLQRPNQFRLTVLGPHGPPVLAAACDGAQLTSLEVASKTFRTQPATPAGIAHFLGGLELGLSAEDWLQLLLGEMAVPDDARARSLGGQGGPKTVATVVWHWANHGRTLAAEFDGATALLRRAAITLGDGRQGTVALGARGTVGIPEQIVLHLGAAPGGKEGAQDLELNLVDVQPMPQPLPQNTFVLALPTAVPSL